MIPSLEEYNACTCPLVLREFNDYMIRVHGTNVQPHWECMDPLTIAHAIKYSSYNGGMRQSIILNCNPECLGPLLKIIYNIGDKYMVGEVFEYRRNDITFEMFLTVPWDHIADYYVPGVRAWAKRYPKSVELEDRIAAKPEEFVKVAMPYFAVREETIDKLLDADPKNYELLLRHNTNLTSKQLYKAFEYAKDGRSYLVKSIASYLKGIPVELQQKIKEYSEDLLMLVKNLDPGLAAELVDKNLWSKRVCMILARNPGLPAELLDKILNAHTSYRVRMELFNNPSLSEKSFLRLLKSVNPKLKIAAANCDRTPDFILAQLAMSQYKGIAANARETIKRKQLALEE